MGAPPLFSLSQSSTIGSSSPSSKMTAVTASFVLRRVNAFLEDALSNVDVRRRALSAARRRLSSLSDPVILEALTLLYETVDLSSSSSATVAAAAAAAATGGSPSALSALFLAISLALRRRRTDAARALFDVFFLDPAPARTDIAPELFEELFLPHLFPVVRWYAERRSQILSSIERGRSAAAMTVLSKMSGGQAVELRELEKTYEGVMDENSRVYAGYLKEILRSGVGIKPPELILPSVNGVEDGMEEVEETEETEDTEELENVKEEFASSDGRFNVLFAILVSSLKFSSFFSNYKYLSQAMIMILR